MSQDVHLIAAWNFRTQENSHRFLDKTVYSSESNSISKVVQILKVIKIIVTSAHEPRGLRVTKHSYFLLLTIKTIFISEIL